LKNLNENRIRNLIALAATFAISFLLVSPVVASQRQIPGVDPNATTYGQVTHGPAPQLLSSPPQFVGGVPFCKSGSLGSILCYDAALLKSAYDFPTGLDGTGQTIVVVDAYGSPTIQSDLDKFDSTFGIPATTVTILCGPTWTGSKTDTCPPFASVTRHDALCGGIGGIAGWAEETTLDVTIAHALAPGAHIVLVVANNCFDNQLSAAESAVVQQANYAGSIMTQSFGEADSLVGCHNLACTSREMGTFNQANNAFSLATQNHWTILASSGDDGANEALSQTGGAVVALTPSWPASSPLVLAVGGTEGNPYGGQYGAPPGKGGTNTCPASIQCNTGLELINGGTNGCTTSPRPGFPSSCVPVGYGGEQVWNEFSVFGIRTSSGGGVSTLYALPSYQSSLPSSWTTLFGNTVVSSGRLNPDVSLNSAIQGGWLCYLGFLGRWAVFGGTSASSPAFAAIIALVNQDHGSPAGFINPAIYALAESPNYGSAFHDITLGENSDTAGAFGVDGFSAAPGYDLTTGWGTPDVANFVSLIQRYL
jgi:subtilase family serine protease